MNVLILDRVVIRHTRTVSTLHCSGCGHHLRVARETAPLVDVVAAAHRHETECDQQTLPVAV